MQRCNQFLFFFLFGGVIIGILFHDEARQRERRDQSSCLFETGFSRRLWVRMASPWRHLLSPFPAFGSFFRNIRIRIISGYW
jgi:hypothetical protein